MTNSTFKALAGGREPPRKRVKELWIIAGRRSGKDSVASGLSAWAAGIEQSHISRLRPGEMASVLCIATDRDQAKIVKRYTDSYFIAIDEPKDKVTPETAVGLELDNAAEIVIATNSHRQARGRAVLLALLDECASYRNETSASPDIEVYRAIVPGLAATIPESMLVAFSSPYRKSGLLFQKWKTHFGQSDDNVLVIQAESRQLNPTLDPQIVADAMKADPAAAMAEWLGLFRDDIGGYVSMELIESAVASWISATFSAARRSGAAFMSGSPSSGSGARSTVGDAASRHPPVASWRRVGEEAIPKPRRELQRRDHPRCDV
jgi:hypothetical protein